MIITTITIQTNITLIEYNVYVYSCKLHVLEYKTLSKCQCKKEKTKPKCSNAFKYTNYFITLKAIPVTSEKKLVDLYILY